MTKKVNLRDKLAQFDDLWSHRLVGEVNDMHVKLVKIEGEFIWHSHDTEDEMFLVVTGELTMRFRDHDETVGPGEFIIIPHGVEHMPVAQTLTEILLLEPGTTVNTGGEVDERTHSPVRL